MKRKKIVTRETMNEVAAPENLTTDENMVTIGNTQCKAWCFLPGLSFVGPNGLLQCMLTENHEEEEHIITISILSPPSGNFKISWTGPGESLSSSTPTEWINE